MPKVKLTNRVLLGFLVKNKIKSRFLKNMKNPQWDMPSKAQTYSLILNDEKSPRSLSNGFKWRRSPEGTDFWDNMDIKYSQYHKRYSQKLN